jgi:hypothetical protein
MKGTWEVPEMNLKKNLWFQDIKARERRLENEEINYI